MIYADGGKILTLESLRRIAEVLPPARFARIPRSYIVALSRIEHVERGKVPVAGRRLPSGDTSRDAFTGPDSGAKSAVGGPHFRRQAVGLQPQAGPAGAGPAGAGPAGAGPAGARFP